VIIGLKKDEGHYVMLRLREGDSVPAGWTTAGQSDFVTSQVALRGAGLKSACSGVGLLACSVHPSL